MTRAEPPDWSTRPVIDSLLDRMQIRHSRVSHAALRVALRPGWCARWWR